MHSLFMSAIQIQPPLSDEIRALQREFAELYGSPAALKPPVHITVGPPIHLPEPDLEHYKRSLEKATAVTPPFGLELDGFDFFEKNRVVFVKVESNKILESLVDIFNESQGIKPKRKYHPHVTIGYRNISPETYKEIKSDYRKRTFLARIQIGSVQLWKHENGFWNTIAKYPLTEN